MNATKGIHHCHVNVVIWLHGVFERIQKVVAQHVALIGRAASKSVDQDDGIFISPMFSRHMFESTIHGLVYLELVERHAYFINQVGHQDQHHDVSILA